MRVRVHSVSVQLPKLGFVGMRCVEGVVFTNHGIAVPRFALISTEREGII